MSKKRAKKSKRPIVVLGAGASRGRHPAGGNYSGSPPIDAEFLAKSREVLLSKGSSNKKSWNLFEKSVRQAGIPSDSLTTWRLEILSTYLEARANVRFAASSGKPPKYKQALENLRQLVCDTLHRYSGTIPCDLHEAMFTAVNPSDVVTFNYDLVADQTLLKLKRLKWSDRAYCPSKTVRLYTVGSRNPSSRRWYKKRRPKLQGRISLYKLHGSMHWNRVKGKKKGYQIAGVKNFPPKNDLLEFISTPSDPFIVPPVAAKMEIQEPALHATWLAAKKALRNAPKWIFWGYSFPATDTITSVLLRTCLQKKAGRKKAIVIINPDIAVIERAKTLLGVKKIKYYPSAERFLVDQGYKVLPGPS